MTKVDRLFISRQRENRIGGFGVVLEKLAQRIESIACGGKRRPHRFVHVERRLALDLADNRRGGKRRFLLFGQPIVAVEVVEGVVKVVIVIVIAVRPAPLRDHVVEELPQALGGGAAQPMATIFVQFEPEVLARLADFIRQSPCPRRIGGRGRSARRRTARRSS